MLFMPDQAWASMEFAGDDRPYRRAPMPGFSAMLNAVRNAMPDTAVTNAVHRLVYH